MQGTVRPRTPYLQGLTLGLFPMFICYCFVTGLLKLELLLLHKLINFGAVSIHLYHLRICSMVRVINFINTMFSELYNYIQFFQLWYKLEVKNAVAKCKTCVGYNFQCLSPQSLADASPMKRSASTLAAQQPQKVHLRDYTLEKPAQERAHHHHHHHRCHHRRDRDKDREKRQRSLDTPSDGQPTISAGQLLPLYITSLYKYTLYPQFLYVTYFIQKMGQAFMQPVTFQDRIMLRLTLIESNYSMNYFQAKSKTNCP